MMDVRRILTVYIPLMVVVSCYFFPFEFTFLPKGINTKIMLAVCGMLFLYSYTLKTSAVYIEKKIVWALLIVWLFCITGFVAVDYNHTEDYSYAFYIFSFGTWMGAAYAIYSMLKLFHERVSFEVLMNYLIAICVVQCILALTIDLVEPLKNIVDTYISQATIVDDKFLEKVDRLYGIGATLDVAGVRFSIVLFGLSVLVCNNEQIRENRWAIAIYLVAFMAISIIGNIISRTTMVGMTMGILYFLFRTGNLIHIKHENIHFWSVGLPVVCIVCFIAIYFYNNDGYFYKHLRYGFEGFFNWLEYGEWRTSSTDRLNSVMWIWPTDLKTWFLGTGIFAKFLGTDIGYCRFVFYGGLPTLIVFSLFFIYNTWACTTKLGPYRNFCIGLLALGFIVWLKVATDLFIMYALLYCMDKEEEGLT